MEGLAVAEEEASAESADEVVVVSINLDGREVDFILSDVLDIDEQKYAVLYSDDEWLDAEDRTLFAKVLDGDGEEQFSLVTDPIEMNMAAGYAALNAVDDLLVGVRAELRQITTLLASLEAEGPEIDKQKILAIIGLKVAGLLDSLNEETEAAESEESDA